MSTHEFNYGESWKGQPIARKVIDAEPRGRAVVTGLIVDVDRIFVGGNASGRFVLDDGTGQVELVFLGRPNVAGLSFGTCLTVEGTVRIEDSRILIWNPLYRIEQENGA
ncbi:MAG TPA: hypothetical protein VFV02_06755 [Acidimicrobiales bacterium]|nr:hypothetical protein [Acidimicrobiales bacterium]